jgi:hypothetical protein
MIPRGGSDVDSSTLSEQSQYIERKYVMALGFTYVDVVAHLVTLAEPQ